MKKLLAAISMLLVLSTMIVACDIISNGDALSTGNESSDELNPDNNDTVDTSIKIEDDADREDKDNEFPFENIIVERNGYDIIAAGRYYGNDFDSVKYYGSYYRIIDNYDDFSELTQWGNKIEKSVFDENFVLVLYSYKSHYLYNSVGSQKGVFNDLKKEANSARLSLRETWVRNNRAEIVDGKIIVSGTNKENEVLFPTEVQETLYLLISKNELPSDLSANGELHLISEIEEME